MSTSPNDGFTLVTYGKRKRQRNSILSFNMYEIKSPGFHYEELPTTSRKKNIIRNWCKTSYDLEKYDIIPYDRTKALQPGFEKSIFFQDFKKLLSSSLQMWNPAKENKDEAIESNQLIDIICYGLGSFLSCNMAASQLMFLLALKDFLNVNNVSVYDPVFSKSEIEYLEKVGLNVLSINEEGKRTIVNKTLFFMPHCDLPLYNNLLWANWNIVNLSKLLIIGNTLSDYDLYPISNLKKLASYVHFVIQFVTEVKILDNLEYSGMNDMSIHYFEDEAMSKVPAHVWLETEEPVLSVNYAKDCE